MKRLPLRTVAIALSATTVAAVTAVVAAAGQPLATVDLTPGSLTASDGLGEIAVLATGSDRLCWWTPAGTPRGCVRLPGCRRGDSPTALRGTEGRFLACFGRTGPPQRCFVVSTATATIVGQFEIADWPAKLFATPRGWLVVPLVPEQGPGVLREIDDSGRTRREMTLPESWQAEMRAAGVNSLAWLPRVFAAAGGVWASPVGHYGFWHLDDPSAAEAKVPVPMFVSSHTVSRSASGRVIRGAELAVHLGDVRDVATTGNLAAVLIAVDPEALDGACRLDLWDFPSARLRGSTPLPGPCPQNVFFGTPGFWLRTSGRFTQLILPSMTTSGVGR